MSDAQAAATPAKKPRKTLLIVLAAVLVAAGAGGGGAWFMLHKRDAGNDAEEAHAEVKKAAKPLFTTLEPFIVNLKDPRGERFAQVGVTLQFDDPQVESDIKDRLPAVRNEILLLISSKQIDELLSVEGKQHLAQEIRQRTGKALGLDLPDLPAPKPAATQVAEAQPAAASAPEAAQGDEDDEAPKPRKAKRHKKAPAVVNPITQVLFSQFIVQ